MESSVKRIVIIGGGITGLSAAYYTSKWFEERNIPVALTLIEKGEKLGGKIRTLHRNDFIIEKGPESFLARKAPIISLIKDLGLEDELTSTNPQAKKSFILHKNKLHAMPPGLVLGIPTEITPFMKTGLVSPLGKVRAAMDLCLPKKKGTADESLGSFIERRLGKEVLEHITEPLLGGIYAGDTYSLSLQATFPHFYEMEKKHRSLILGMLANKSKQAPSENVPKIAKQNMFLTFKNGMSTLVDRLEEALQSITIQTGHGVEEITQNGRCYEVCVTDGEKLLTDGLILALPTFEAAKLVENIVSLNWLNEINYVSVANIALAFEKKDILFPLNGSGFVIPRKEGRNLTACTWSSSKWLHAAPSDKVLLRCYVGRGGAEQWVHLTEQELLAKVLSDLDEIMGIKATPLFHEITRLCQSMPQYPVEHAEKLKEVRETLQTKAPGIYVCGAGYEGVGVPDCIDQGKRAAEQVVNYFNTPVD
ncbi:protoporphyrinogen oxidase [Psychrobacillus sp.]|uniref:protoporphyrinogen oxidase n=1 Tax=Psychrobacillus sp. TaxID=1871623 RepID=UPI0028BE8F18|nr:protoporphyrinogen oxidase [Psychrobacillus sp.]